MKKSSRQVLLLCVTLIGILAVAVWAAVDAWTSMDAASGGGQITWQGLVALMAGALGTLVVGVGLMALVFYSSRHRYDDRSGPDHVRRRPSPGTEPPDRAP